MWSVRHGEWSEFKHPKWSFHLYLSPEKNIIMRNWKPNGTRIFKSEMDKLTFFGHRAFTFHMLRECVKVFLAASVSNSNMSSTHKKFRRQESPRGSLQQYILLWHLNEFKSHQEVLGKNKQTNKLKMTNFQWTSCSSYSKVQSYATSRRLAFV